MTTENVRDADIKKASAVTSADSLEAFAKELYGHINTDADRTLYGCEQVLLDVVIPLGKKFATTDAAALWWSRLMCNITHHNARAQKILATSSNSTSSGHPVLDAVANHILQYVTSADAAKFATLALLNSMSTGRPAQSESVALKFAVGRAVIRFGELIASAGDDFAAKKWLKLALVASASWQMQDSFNTIEGLRTIATVAATLHLPSSDSFSPAAVASSTMDAVNYFFDLASELIDTNFNPPSALAVAQLSAHAERLGSYATDHVDDDLGDRNARYWHKAHQEKVRELTSRAVELCRKMARDTSIIDGRHKTEAADEKDPRTHILRAFGKHRRVIAGMGESQNWFLDIPLARWEHVYVCDKDDDTKNRKVGDIMISFYLNYGTIEDLPDFSKLPPQVYDFKFHECANLRGDLDLRKITNTKLEVLKLTGSNGSIRNINDFLNFSSLLPSTLRTLEICGQQTNITGGLSLQGLPKSLTHLVLARNGFSGVLDLSGVAESNLQELDLSGNHKMTGDLNLDVLSQGAASLKKLDLGGLKSLNPGPLPDLSKLPPNLEWLALCRSNRTGELDLTQLARGPAAATLTNLNLADNSLGGTIRGLGPDEDDPSLLLPPTMALLSSNGRMILNNNMFTPDNQWHRLRECIAYDKDKQRPLLNQEDKMATIVAAKRKKFLNLRASCRAQSAKDIAELTAKLVDAAAAAASGTSEKNAAVGVALLPAITKATAMTLVWDYLDAKIAKAKDKDNKDVTLPGRRDAPCPLLTLSNGKATMSMYDNGSGRYRVFNVFCDRDTIAKTIANPRLAEGSSEANWSVSSSESVDSDRWTTDIIWTLCERVAADGGTKLLQRVDGCNSYIRENYGEDDSTLTAVDEGKMEAAAKRISADCGVLVAPSRVLSMTSWFEGLADAFKALNADLEQWTREAVCVHAPE